MAYIVIRHKVKDYGKWKPAFDEHGTTRKAGGSKGGRLFHSADDPNHLVILFEWDNLDRAQQFVGSEDLREKMEEAGVAEQPDIYFLNELESFGA